MSERDLQQAREIIASYFLTRAERPKLRDRIAASLADRERATWATVFNVISAHSYNGVRELVKRLEEAREEAGYGPSDA